VFHVQLGLQFNEANCPRRTADAWCRAGRRRRDHARDAAFSAGAGSDSMIDPDPRARSADGTAISGVRAARRDDLPRPAASICRRDQNTPAPPALPYGSAHKTDRLLGKKCRAEATILRHAVAGEQRYPLLTARSLSVCASVQTANRAWTTMPTRKRARVGGLRRRGAWRRFANRRTRQAAFYDAT
jgi:hypothetical protein